MSRWVLILGVSSGFGAAAARAFARAGYDVAGVHLDRRAGQAAADALAEELRALGREACFFNLNAADDDRRAEVLAELRARVAPGGLAVLLHSLAFGSLVRFIPDDPGAKGVTRKQLDMTLDVMANSLVYWTQDLVAGGLLGHGGRVFAMTSSGSLAMWPAYGAVSAAKCALESHIRQIAVELAPQGVTANAIMAGVTRTPALSKIPGAEEIARRALERNPAQRLTTVDDVAQCLLALAGPGTQWMTGNVIRVDGGESVAG